MGKRIARCISDNGLVIFASKRIASTLTDFARGEKRTEALAASRSFRASGDNAGEGSRKDTPIGRGEHLVRDEGVAGSNPATPTST